MVEFVGPVLEHLTAFEKELVTTEPARADLGVFKNPYSGLAASMREVGDNLTRRAEESAEREGEVAGAKMVTRDANGNVQVRDTGGMLPIGPAREKYIAGMRIGALAEADGSFRRDEIAARDKFRDDPEGYNRWLQNYQSGVEEQFAKDGHPEIGIAARRAIDNTGTQTYKGLLAEKDRLDLQRTEGAIKAGIDTAQDDALAMARGGASADDPHLQQALDKYVTLQQQRAENPRMAYSHEQMQLDLDTFKSQIAGERFLYGIDQTYKDKGAQAAEEEAKAVLTNPDLTLKPSAREAYYHKALGEVHQNEAIRRQDVSEARAAANETLLASQLGVPIDPTQVNDIASAFRKAGDPGAAARFLGTMSRKDLNDDFGRQPIADQAAQISNLSGVGRAQAAILGQESGNRDNAPTSIDGARGPGQIEPETFAQFALPGERIDNPADNRRVSQRIVADYYQRYGGDVARVAVAYFSGPGNVAPAGSATPYLRNAADGNGKTTASYVNDVLRRAGEGPVGKPEGVGVNTLQSNPANSLWLLNNRQKDLNAELSSQWKTIMSDYDKDKVTPNPKVVGDLVDAAYASGNGALLDQIGHDMARIEFLSGETAKPLSQQEADIGKLSAAGAAGGLEPGQGAILKELQARHEAIVKGLNENPIQTTVANFQGKVAQPDPLDFQDPQKLIQGLQQRAKIAQFAGQNWGVAPPAALDKQDIDQLKGALAAAQPAEKAGIYGALATLPEQVRSATLRKLGGNQPLQLAETAAGGMMATAPDIGFSIFNGLSVLKGPDGKKFDPETDGKENFRGDLSAKLPPSALASNFREGPTSPYSTLTELVKGRYADLSFQKGDTTYNASRLKQAIDDVTGGVLSFNGSSVIAPRRGMSQAEFDGVMGSLSAADLQGVSTLGGQAISPDALRSRGRLEAAGPGKYFVSVGEDQRGPVYAYQNGRKFTLDLSNRAAAQPTTRAVPSLSITDFPMTGP